MAEWTMKDVVEAKLREFVTDELFVEEDRSSQSTTYVHPQENA